MIMNSTQKPFEVMMGISSINEFNMICSLLPFYNTAIETTLWSTEWGIAELINNPEIQKKLRDELETVLGKGVHITEPDFIRLPYLQVNE